MSIYTNILTGGSNNHQTTSENANQVQTDFISEGVVGAITNTSGVAPATGAFAVNAQGTPDMTVAVSSGVAYVQATPSGQASQVLRVYNNASANVTIAANSSGSTKYDWVYISVSAANAANPNTAGDNVATLVTSRSSSLTSDDGTPPSFGYPLAVVTVANAASSITNGNIKDIRVNALMQPLKEPATSEVVTSETTTSTSFVNLITTQSISVTVGSTGYLLVGYNTQMSNSGANDNFAAPELSGANTYAATNNDALTSVGVSAFGFGRTKLFTGLNPGVTTVTLKFRVAGGTGTFLRRSIWAVPL